nr:protein SAMBA isoform X1 [Ipomoea batatas]
MSRSNNSLTSSPARSSVSTTAIVGANATAAASEDYHFPADLISIQDRKDEALQVYNDTLFSILHPSPDHRYRPPERKDSVMEVEPENPLFIMEDLCDKTKESNPSAREYMRSWLLEIPMAESSGNSPSPSKLHVVDVDADMIIGEVVKLARLNRVKLNGEDPVAGIPLAALVHQAHELPGGAHRRQVFGRGDNKRHAVAALGGV